MCCLNTIDKRNTIRLAKILATFIFTEYIKLFGIVRMSEIVSDCFHAHLSNCFHVSGTFRLLIRMTSFQILKKSVHVNIARLSMYL